MFEIAGLLLVGPRAEHEAVVDPDPDHGCDVWSPVVPHGGQPVELGAGQRPFDGLPVGRFVRVTEALVEFAVDRHGDIDSASRPDSSRDQAMASTAVATFSWKSFGSGTYPGSARPAWPPQST